MFKQKWVTFLKNRFCFYLCVDSTAQSIMKFSLALIRCEQNILPMSSFLLGNYCSLFPCECTFCSTAWLSLWRNLNACCGYLLFLPGTAGTNVNLKLPLPQTITNFCHFDSVFKRIYVRFFSYLRKISIFEWA